MAKKSAYRNFTKAHLIQEISERHNTTKRIASLIVETILESITRNLKQGNRVELRGLGTFELRKYGSYEGRNPKTGEKIQVQPKRLPFFKPGKVKNTINKKK